MNLIKSSLFVLTLALSCAFTLYHPMDEAANTYLDEYGAYAVAEMYRSGIPASITLAQALHETNYGSSDLAALANNHFGIKCKSYWQGKTYQHKDDDYDTRGNLMHSCFRAYDSVFDSYIDHSNFLTQTKHYAPLFEHDKEDYVSWAKALKACGYATDPQYAEKLINKIERYQLYLYDQMPNPLAISK